MYKKGIWYRIQAGTKSKTCAETLVALTWEPFQQNCKVIERKMSKSSIMLWTSFLNDPLQNATDYDKSTKDKKARINKIE